VTLWIDATLTLKTAARPALLGRHLLVGGCSDLSMSGFVSDVNAWGRSLVAAEIAEVSGGCSYNWCRNFA
jgi:hypothetical protein